MSETDLKSLIDLGCIRDSINIGNTIFVMRTLNVSERISLSSFIGEDQDTQKQFDFNVKLLAIAIETVNGKLLEELHPDTEKDSILAKIDLLSAMQPPVLAKLLEFYTEITKRADTQFTLEQVKNL
jgi:hypothetical protein